MIFTTFFVYDVSFSVHIFQHIICINKSALIGMKSANFCINFGKFSFNNWRKLSLEFDGHNLVVELLPYRTWIGFYTLTSEVVFPTLTISDRQQRKEKYNRT